MATFQRRMTKAQGDRNIVRYQQSMTGGMNCDENPALLQSGQMAEIVNMEVRGSRLASIQGFIDIDVNLPWSNITSGEIDVIDYGIGVSSRVVGYQGNLVWVTCYVNSDDLVYGGKYVLRVFFDDDVDYKIIVNKGTKVLTLTDGLLIYDRDTISRISFLTKVVALKLPLNKEAPHSPIVGPAIGTGLNVTGSIPLSDDGVIRKYNACITLAYREGDVLLWESPPLTFGSQKRNSFSLNGGDISGESISPFYVAPSNWEIASGIAYNKLRLWRTQNCLINGVEVQLPYRLEKEFELEELPDLSSHEFLSDEDIAFNEVLTITSSHKPFSDISIIKANEAFLFVGSGNYLRYADMANLAGVGYYFAGMQEIKERSPVTAIGFGSGYALVATASTLRRVSLENTQNVSLYEGVYEPVFVSTPYISESVGIPDNYEGALTDSSNGLLMLCSDNRVRRYNGANLLLPLDRGLIEKLLRGIDSKAVAVWSPEGYWQLHWEGGAVRLRTWQGAEGQEERAWSKIEVGDVVGKPFVVTPDMGFVDFVGIVFYQDDFKGMSATTYLDDVDDLPWSVTTPRYKGEGDGYMVGHRETLLTINGEFSKGNFEILADGRGDTDDGVRVAYNERIRLVGDQVEASLSITRGIQNMRFAQMRISGEETKRFELTRIQSYLRVSDRPYRKISVLQKQDAFRDATCGFFANCKTPNTVLHGVKIRDTLFEANSGWFATAYLEMEAEGEEVFASAWWRGDGILFDVFGVTVSSVIYDDEGTDKRALNVQTRDGQQVFLELDISEAFAHLCVVVGDSTSVYLNGEYIGGVEHEKGAGNKLYALGGYVLRGRPAMLSDAIMHDVRCGSNFDADELKGYVEDYEETLGQNYVFGSEVQ